jgi:uncharacterized membrane protein
VVLGLAGAGRAGLRDRDTPVRFRDFVQPFAQQYQTRPAHVCHCVGASAGSLLVAPTEGIWFGVLHCYGVCMLLWGLLGDVERRADARLWVPLLLLFFAVLRFIASGTVWLPFLGTIALPDALYQSQYLFWLGFPRSDFVSADYWPLLPWGLLFVAGGLLGQHWHRYGFPDWLRNRAFAPLAAFGRHTLSVYLIHQPVFIGLLWLWFHFFPIVQSYLR